MFAHRAITSPRAISERPGETGARRVSGYRSGGPDTQAAKTVLVPFVTLVTSCIAKLGKKTAEPLSHRGANSLETQSWPPLQLRRLTSGIIKVILLWSPVL